MTIKPLLFAVVAMSTLAAETPLRQVPVEILHKNGSFSGMLSVSLSGFTNKAKIEWIGTIRNTATHKVFRVTFCVKAWDTADQQIKPGGNECLLTLWGSNWETNLPLSFKGKQNLMLSEEKSSIQVAKYIVTASEVFDHSPNLRQLDVPCPIVWSYALRVFADKKFRPTVLDKDSFTATYAYDGGSIDGYSDAPKMLKAFTNANTAFMGPTWESFRIDAASLYLREENAGACTAEVKMSFAGLGKPFMGTLGWFAVESNFSFEKALLDGLAEQSKTSARADLVTAINQLPTPALSTTDDLAKPQLTITSEPSGAEIEIDGEFIGNTPTTVTAKEGKAAVKIKKNGLQPWERILTLNAGDKRTLNAEMVK